MLYGNSALKRFGMDERLWEAGSNDLDSLVHHCVQVKTCGCIHILPSTDSQFNVLLHAAVLLATFTAVACVPVQDSYFSKDTGFVHTTWVVFLCPLVLSGLNSQWCVHFSSQILQRSSEVWPISVWHPCQLPVVQYFADTPVYRSVVINSAAVIVYYSIAVHHWCQHNAKHSISI